MHRIHSQFQQEAERRANNAIVWRGATFLFIVIALFAVAAAWPNPPSIKQLGVQCVKDTADQIDRTVPDVPLQPMASCHEYFRRLTR